VRCLQRVVLGASTRHTECAHQDCKHPVRMTPANTSHCQFMSRFNPHSLDSIQAGPVARLSLQHLFPSHAPCPFRPTQTGVRHCIALPILFCPTPESGSSVAEESGMILECVAVPLRTQTIVGLSHLLRALTFVPSFECWFLSRCAGDSILLGTIAQRTIPHEIVRGHPHRQERLNRQAHPEQEEESTLAIVLCPTWASQPLSA
jgi:hypothetical protein